MTVLTKLVVKTTSVGGVIVYAHVEGSPIAVLFQRLDGKLISSGLIRRKITCPDRVLLEDWRTGRAVSGMVCLNNLSDKASINFAA